MERLRLRKMKGERAAIQVYYHSQPIPGSVVSPKATASSFACRSEVSPKSGDEGDMIPLG